MIGRDYSRDGKYFITICTKNRRSIFGEFIYESDCPVISLSELGNIVLQCWNDLPNHYPNIILDEFIVMPNHLHGIIIIHNCADQKGKIHGVSEFIRALKSFSSRRINDLNHKINGIWQPGYYDHIIRSNDELKIIRAYIKNNASQYH